LRVEALASNVQALDLTLRVEPLASKVQALDLLGLEG